MSPGPSEDFRERLKPDFDTEPHAPARRHGRDRVSVAWLLPPHFAAVNPVLLGHGPVPGVRTGLLIKGQVLSLEEDMQHND